LIAAAQQDIALVKRLFLKAAGVAAAGALLKACGGGGGGSGSPTGSLTLLQLLQQDGRFSTLLTALQNAGLADQLGQSGANQTLFAPTNDAFNTLTQRVGALSAAKLAEFIGFHVVPQFLSAAALRSLAVNGQRPDTLYSFRSDPAVLIFVTDNGPLNIWDGIGRTSITIPEPDVAASNGVLHVVSDVLVPRGVLTVAQVLLASIDSFSEFSASVQGSTFTTLNGTASFTVFVPGNDAVNGSLLDNVVRQHIVAGEIGSNTFVQAGATLTTLNNQQVTLRKGSGAVLATLNYGAAVQATVTDVDFFASNGVIHVINSVLVPR
jgi:transforming growth factor-beta-induced protein